MSMFQAGDVLVKCNPVEVYHITRLEAFSAEVKSFQPTMVTWHVPLVFLEASRQGFTHLNAAGEVKSPVYPGLIELGWNPDLGQAAISWAIQYIKRLEALVKETKADETVPRPTQADQEYRSLQTPVPGWEVEDKKPNDRAPQYPFLT